MSGPAARTGGAAASSIAAARRAVSPFSHIHQLPSLVSWYKRMRERDDHAAFVQEAGIASGSINYP